MFHLQRSFNSVAAAISQKAAEISLKNPVVKEKVKEEIERIRKTRDYVVDKVRNMGSGLSCFMPEACPYLYVKYQRDISSYDLCEDIILKCSVVVSPGRGNGSIGEGHFCITYADSIDVVKEGMKRLEEYFKTN